VATDSLSIDQARRLALAAQGFDLQPASGASTRRKIQAVIERLGLLQIDFVNVLVPAHHLVVYSRMGPYERQELNKLVYGGTAFTEQWAHEASIVPVAAWPLLKYRRDAYRPWANSPLMKLRNKTKYLSQIIEIIEEKGPVTATDLPAVKGPKRGPGGWHRSLARWGLEYHFGCGRLAVADRLANFQRVYDLSERLIPERQLAQELDREAAQRKLLSLAAAAMGVATLRDLADYYRMPVPQARPRVMELVEQGSITPVTVEGWTEPGFRARGTRIPRCIETASLLSPFDPVVWYRPRAERLFDFHYRIEIYVPAARRKWGYYVLPFLLDDRIVARVDLKADRSNNQLLVPAAHAESDVDEGLTAMRLAEALQTLATWLGLDSVNVAKRGSFARRLQGESRAVRRRAS
jgi:uncharacterized protein YcaQ